MKRVVRARAADAGARTIVPFPLPAHDVSTSGISFVGDDRALPERVGRLLGLDLSQEDDLARLAVSGVSVRAFNEFAKQLPLPKRLVRSVLHRQRKGAGLRLSPMESEVVLRIARSYAHAQLALGDDARALAWFTAPANYLDGYSEIAPLELSMTETGARLVEARLRAHATAATREDAVHALSPSARSVMPAHPPTARTRVDVGPTARI